MLFDASSRMISASFVVAPSSDASAAPCAFDFSAKVFHNAADRLAEQTSEQVKVFNLASYGCALAEELRFDVQTRHVVFGREVQAEYGLFFAGGCVSHLQHKVGFTEFFQVKVPREPYAKVKVKFVLNIEIEREFKVGTVACKMPETSFPMGNSPCFSPRSTLISTSSAMVSISESPL